MKAINKSMLILACFFLPGFLHAQTDIDALRFSKQSFGSTARSMAMGGAFGALGGDLSVLSQNPAGIGLYRKSEFSISPMFNYNLTHSSYIDNDITDGRFNFGFSNLGAVFTHTLKKSSLWKSWNFGIGYNRVNSYSGRSGFDGRNNANSLLDSYAEESNGILPSDLENSVSFEAFQAFNNYLLDSINTNQYYTALPNAGEIQSKYTRTRGSLGEWDISFGGNYSDKLYLGATLGITTIRYIEDSEYEEKDDQNLHDSIAGFDFSSFSLYQYLNTSGTGINFKIGAIYKPSDWVRIGAAFHTPTFYNLSDDYSSFLVARFAGQPDFESTTLQGAYDYSLTTPFKAIGSVAFIIGNYGLLSADYEYTDYANARLNSRNYNFKTENSNINRKYNATSNLKVGGEFRYEVFSFRLGCAYYGTPFKNGLNKKSEDQHQINYTGGIGIRGKNGYIDFGYALAQSSSFYKPYGLISEEVPGVISKSTDHRFVITFGVKW